MDGFFTLAMILLFGLSVFVLARADGWSKPASLGLSVGIFACPAIVFLVLYTLRASAFVFEILLGIAGVGAFVVLFALSKSVSNKVKMYHDAPR